MPDLCRLMLTFPGSGSHIEIVRLDGAINVSAQPSLDLTSKHTLTSAHGEEVVRAIVIDEQVRTRAIPVFRSSHNLVGVDFHCW